MMPTMLRMSFRYGAADQFVLESVNLDVTPSDPLVCRTVFLER
jgi:hypothetical protein